MFQIEVHRGRTSINLLLDSYWFFDFQEVNQLMGYFIWWLALDLRLDHMSRDLRENATLNDALGFCEHRVTVFKILNVKGLVNVD